MKVAFHARILCDPRFYGWTRYTVNLLGALGRAGIHLLLCSSDSLQERHLARLDAGSYEIRLSPHMPYLAWEQIWLPRQCAIDRADVLHTPLNFGLPWFGPCPRVITLHDAIDRIFYGSSWREKLSPGMAQIRLQQWIARTRAERIITVSRHSKCDLAKHLGIATERIVVIHEAADPRFHLPVSGDAREQVRQKYGLSGRYVLYVGNSEKRKNLPFLIRAFAAAGLENTGLVLAGVADKLPGSRSDPSDELARLAHSLGLAEKVRLLGQVDDDDLPALYAEAFCFVYPSRYEGFGLQLCEGMAVGCPTLAADTSALPEILGDGGETFPVDETAALAALIRRLVEDPGYRDAMIRRARERSKEFSWEKAARETIAVYEALASRLKSPATRDDPN